MLQLKTSKLQTPKRVLLLLGASLVLGTAPGIAAADSQTTVQDKADRGEWHRHGPPSKGFYHTHSHMTSTEVEQRSATPRRYGPPSKRFRSWSHPSKDHQAVLRSGDERRRRGPPRKLPGYRR